jgi:hypothetical protein
MTRAAKLGDLKVIVDKRILAHRIEKSHKSNQFVSLARAIMLGNGKVIDTCETGLPESLQNIVKAGVAAGSVGGSHWADELASYNSLASSVRRLSQGRARHCWGLVSGVDGTSFRNAGDYF